MITIIILLIIAIGLIAGLGFAALSLIKSSEAYLSVQKDQGRAANIVASIASAVDFQNGSLLIPVDIGPDGPLALVPSHGPFKKNNSGTSISFCPVGKTDHTGATKMVENGSPTASYSVELTEKPAGSGNWYVSSGAPAIAVDDLQTLRDKGVVAYIITPGPNTDTVLPCASAYIPDGTDSELVILADGGSVTPVLVMDDELKVGQHLSVGNAHSAPGNAKNFSTIDDAISYAETLDLLHTTIWVSPSSTATLTAIQKLSSGFEGKTVILKGAGATDVSVTPAGTADVATNLSIDGVNMNAGGSLTLNARPDADLHISNSNIGGIENTGGRVTLQSATIQTASGSTSAALYIDGGTTFIDGSSAINAPTAIAAISMNGGTLDVSGTPEVTISVAADLIIRSGETKTTGEGFNVNRAGSVAIEGFRETVENTCSDGDTDCTATCNLSRQPVRGECSSANRHPMSGFGIVGNGYACAWTGPINAQTVASPKAVVECE